MALEYKSTKFEVKDINRGDRSAVIAFASYNNIDRSKDILRKGAFTKTWAENKPDIRFFLNHNPDLVPGKPTDFFEDDNHAYMKAYLGTHTLGEDTLKMMDEGIITDASFSFKPIKHSMVESKGVKVRELKEVYQGETSVLTAWGCNPMSKVQTVSKSWDRNIEELKEHLENLEKFCRNTTASDDCIKSLLAEVDSIKSILSIDTAGTQMITEPAASNEEADEDEILSQILLMQLN